MATLYLVRAEAPEPAWIRWDGNTGLPQFTFEPPTPMTRTAAVALRDRARICCGGTLSVVVA